MFATLALRSIKCVNSNLLGNLESHHVPLCPNCGRLRTTPSDSGRPVLAGLLNLGSLIGHVVNWSRAIYSPHSRMDCLDQNWIEQVSTIAYIGSNGRWLPDRGRRYLLGPRKWMDNLPSKMNRRKRTQEMELSLYYRGVEPHIGHPLPRTKASAALDHLNQHWTRLGYSFNSISIPFLEGCPRAQKVQGVHMLQIEVP
jgi:hypothetical protein